MSLASRVPPPASPEDMAYFNAKLGQRPADAPSDEMPAKPATPHEQSSALFAAHLGTRPAQAAAKNERQQNEAIFSACPLCRGALEQRGGVYHCVGRCGARWLEDVPGKLVDLAALPWGICACCLPPQALVRSENGAICPTTSNEYLLLAGGPQLRASTAPLGLCQCCAPPAPLVWRGTALVCQAKPEQQYQRDGNRITLMPRVSTSATQDAIDAALRQNSARLTVNGLFDID